MFTSDACALANDRFGRSIVVGQNSLFFKNKYEQDRVVNYDSNLHHTAILQVIVEDFSGKNFYRKTLPVLSALASQKVGGFTFFERVSLAEGQLVKGLQAAFTLDIIQKMSLSLTPESAVVMFEEVAKDYGVKTMVPATLVETTLAASKATIVAAPEAPQPPAASYEELVAIAATSDEVGVRTETSTDVSFEEKEMEARLMQKLKVKFFELLLGFNPKTPVDYIDIVESADEGEKLKVVRDLGGEYLNTYTLTLTDAFLDAAIEVVKEVVASEVRTIPTVGMSEDDIVTLKATLEEFSASFESQMRESLRKEVERAKAQLTEENRVPASTEEAVIHVASSHRRNRSQR